MQASTSGESFSDLELNTDSPPNKKSKPEPSCIIHYPEEDSNAPLISPKDIPSWKTLLNAAQVRQHKPLLDIAKELPEETIPQILYHRQCRSRFTLKRDLLLLQKPNNDEHNKGSVSGSRLKRSKATSSTVYDSKCIFCEKEKYRKGTKSREPVVKCTELRCDQRIRECAILKKDTKITAIASRDMVAAEAHYHHSCYRMYTKIETDTTDAASLITEEEYLYNESERQAYQSMFTFIRNDLFVRPRVVKLSELTRRLTEDITLTGIPKIKDSTKKHIRRSIEKEFADTIRFCNDDKGKVLLFPSSLTAYELAKENQKLKDMIQLLTATLGLAVASSSEHEWVDRHLERVGLFHHFDHVVCRDDVGGRAKPAPDVFLRATELLGIGATKTGVVEDSPHGLAAATAAGLRAVVVPNPLVRHLEFPGAAVALERLDAHPPVELLKLLAAS